MSTSPLFSDDGIAVGTGVEDFRVASARRRLIDNDDGHTDRRMTVPSAASIDAFQPQSSDHHLETESLLTKNLRAEATRVFSESAAAVNKLEAMCESDDAFRKINISLTVERKMDMYKNLLESRGKEALFDVLLGETQCGVRITKTNELLSKTNAELTEQLAFAREIAGRKQAEAVQKLKDVVSASLSLADRKENEALDWKSKHDLFAAQHDRNNAEMRTLRNKLDEAHAIQESLSKEQGILRNKLDSKDLELEDKNRIISELQTTKTSMSAKIQQLQTEVERKTEEIVELDTDLRKKRELVDRVNNQYRVEIKKNVDAVERKANEHLEMAEKTLTERHEAERRELLSKLQHAVNEKELVQRTAAKHEERIRELAERNRELESDVRHSERTARAKCIRQIMTATVRAEVTDSDSSDTLRSIGNRAHGSGRSGAAGSSKRVGFQEAPGSRNSPRKKVSK